MSLHYDTNCPLVMVECPLSAVGACSSHCSGKTSHANMRGHVSAATDVDLVLSLASQVRDLTQENSKRKQQQQAELFSSREEDFCQYSTICANKRRRPLDSNATYSRGSVFYGRYPKAWHSEHHGDCREVCREEIIVLLKTRRPNATDDWRDKLPHMASRLSDALYHEASSLREYLDSGTLKVRLQRMALSMGGGDAGRVQH
eukprot:gene26428-33006_t